MILRNIEMRNGYAKRRNCSFARVALCGFIVLMKSLEAVKALDLLKLVTQYHMMVIYQYYCVSMANRMLQ